MSTMSHLIEYLLAASRPGGGQLVKFGGASLQVPIFPAGLSVAFTLLPPTGSFACIEYWARYAPQIVPDAFEQSVTHSGLLIESGPITRSMIAEGHNTWIVYKELDPVQQTIQNVSGVDQMFEAMRGFLVIDSAEDFKEVEGIINRWGVSASIEALQGQTNDLLRQLVTLQGGVEALPRPPATGGGG